MFNKLPTTRTEWKGKEYRYRLESDGLRYAWLKGTIPERLTKYEFTEVPYDGYVSQRF